MGRYVPNGVKLKTIDGLVHRVGIALLNARKIWCNFGTPVSAWLFQWHQWFRPNANSDAPVAAFCAVQTSSTPYNHIKPPLWSQSRPLESERLARPKLVGQWLGMANTPTNFECSVFMFYFILSWQQDSPAHSRTMPRVVRFKNVSHHQPYWSIMKHGPFLSSQ